VYLNVLKKIRNDFSTPEKGIKFISIYLHTKFSKYKIYGHPKKSFRLLSLATLQNPTHCFPNSSLTDPFWPSRSNYGSLRSCSQRRSDGLYVSKLKKLYLGTDM